MSREKILSIDKLMEVVDKLKKSNKKIVTTNGIFDILHIGHVRYLQDAKKWGDILVVCVNSDVSTKKIKGPQRPLNNENDRAEMLAALQCVDYVTIFAEENPIKILGIIKPDIHVKGGDYQPDQLVEADTVRKNGGEVHIQHKIEGYSTTRFIHTIMDRFKDKKI